MPDDAFRPRIDPAIRGAARAFVHRLDEPAFEADRCQRAAVKYVADLQKRRPGKWHRPEHLDQIVRLWELQPTAGSLMPPQISRQPKRLRLRALRLMSARSTKPIWDGAELGVVVVQSGLDLDRRGYATDSGPLVSISHHALGRRQQRRFGGDSDEDIVGDIRTLVVHFAKSRPTMDNVGQPFEVDCVDTGVWQGTIHRISYQGREFTVLDARTFIS